eukprot:jgi/Tetstr1/462392/TSEL_007398.t1
MGVKCVLRWVNPDPVVRDHPRAVFTVLGAALEALDGRKVSKWKLNCTALKPKVDEGKSAAAAKAGALGHKEMHLLAFSECRDRQFLLLKQERQVLEADKSVRALLEKMGVYAQRFSLDFEGHLYSVGDFAAKLGRAQTTAEEFKGIVVEVEYRPIGQLEAAQPILREFVQLLQQAITQQQALYARIASAAETERCAGHLELVAAPLAEYPVPRTFGFQHAAVQYVAVCGALLSQGGAAAARAPGKT